jgi:hypothetical protein
MPSHALLFAMAQAHPSQACDTSFDQVQQFFDLKIAMASSIGFFALVAEAATELHGWEDVGLKGLLIGAVVYLIRAQAQDRKDHRVELAAAWAEHKKESEGREARATAAITANTNALSELTKLAEEQIDYFKGITKAVVDEKFKPKS